MLRRLKMNLKIKRISPFLIKRKTKMMKKMISKLRMLMLT